MTGKTHQIVGITAGLGFYLTQVEPTYSPATLAAVLVGSHLAALLPDLDNSAADFWHSLPFGHAAGKIVDPLIKHRNFTHSIFGLGLAGIGLNYLFTFFPAYWGINANVVFIAMLVSYASHLFSDMFTVEGIPLLWPYKRMFGVPPKPFHSFRVMTGKWFENLVIFPLVNVSLIVLIISQWQTIKTILFK